MGLFLGKPARARSCHCHTLGAILPTVSTKNCLNFTSVRLILTWPCRQAFQHYVGQDAFFLKAFAQAYALALVQTTDSEERNTLQTLLAGVDQELKLHQAYAKVLSFAIYCMNSASSNAQFNPDAELGC